MRAKRRSIKKSVDMKEELMKDFIDSEQEEEKQEASKLITLTFRTQETS